MPTGAAPVYPRIEAFDPERHEKMPLFVDLGGFACASFKAGLPPGTVDDYLPGLFEMSGWVVRTETGTRSMLMSHADPNPEDNWVYVYGPRAERDGYADVHALVPLLDLVCARCTRLFVHSFAAANGPSATKVLFRGEEVFATADAQVADYVAARLPFDTVSFEKNTPATLRNTGGILDWRVFRSGT